MTGMNILPQTLIFSGTLTQMIIMKPSQFFLILSLIFFYFLFFLASISTYMIVLLLRDAGIYSGETFGIPNLGSLEGPYVSDTLNVASGHYKRSPRVHPANCTAQKSNIQALLLSVFLSRVIYKKYDGA